jgi:hypothetical protein
VSDSAAVIAGNDAKDEWNFYFPAGCTTIWRQTTQSEEAKRCACFTTTQEKVAEIPDRAILQHDRAMVSQETQCVIQDREHTGQREK